MRRRASLAAPALVALASAACGGAPAVHFSESNARAHLTRLAGAIGSRPVGSAANAEARVYLVDQLRLYGFDIRVQETDARLADAGLTARVANIIAVKPGASTDAVALVAHYDSVPHGPGAGDDAFGTAVAVEAGRVLAARPAPRYSLMILLTDGEEVGLAGATALVEDRSVGERVRAYLNLEAIGSDGPALLFETGPGNGWLLDAWSRHAPYPRGASYAAEVYRHLPNDTDFSVFRRAGIPGLNFALIGDGYAYHTARDVPERITDRALRHAGANVVAIVEALDRMDLSQRSADEAIFFDVSSTRGLSYGPAIGRAIGLASVLLALAAWLRLVRAAVASGGAHLLLTAGWSLVGLAASAGAMVGAVWALRASRETYHPWYAHPDRLWALIVACAVTAGWLVGRVAVRLPWRPAWEPAAVWSVALPIWLTLAAVTEWLSSGASFLWTIPTLAAGALLLVTSPRHVTALRLASAVILGVAGTLWLHDALVLFRFMVAAFGRAPAVTPIWIYPAFVFFVGLMVAPPLLAVLAGRERRVLSPAIGTALAWLALVVTAGLAYAAPAYTTDRPLRRQVRYLQNEATGRALWEVGSTEPGLDLEGDALAFGWQRATDAPPIEAPADRLPHPFVFRSPAAGGAAMPASVSARLDRRDDEAALEVSVVPAEPGLIASLVLPVGVTPRRSNLPGRAARQGPWRAMYVALPPEGIAFRVTLAAADAAAALDGGGVEVLASRLPGGPGDGRLPGWLPQDRAVWSAGSQFFAPLALR